MMFYLAKVVEATGIVIIAAGFISAFPELMSVKTLLSGGIVFVAGWAIERYLVKSR